MLPSPPCVVEFEVDASHPEHATKNVLVSIAFEGIGEKKTYKPYSWDRIQD